MTIPPTTYPMSSVESKDKYYFPTLSGQGAPSTGIGSTNQPSTTGVSSSQSQISQNEINQLTNDINDAKNTANNVAASYGKVAQSFKDVKNTTDALFIISIVSVGIGAAGVVIAVIAFTRKTQV